MVELEAAPNRDPDQTLSVLIVGYRNRAHLEACISGLLRSLEGVNSEILFIDCSDDGSERFVRERFPTVKVLASQGNLGFGGGNNFLAAHASGALLLLLNPDTAPAGDEIARLVRLAEAHPHGGAWGGRCIHPDGTPDHGSHQPMLTPLGILRTALGFGTWGGGALRIGASGLQRVPVISGAFLLTTRTMWREVGGFDPSFFLYAEETDLCKRIAATGRPLLVDPSITLIHDAGSGDRFNPNRRVNLLKGNATFLRKHHGPIAARLGLSAMVLNEALRLCLSLSVLPLKRSPRATALRLRSLHALRELRAWWPGWPRKAGATSTPCPRRAV